MQKKKLDQVVYEYVVNQINNEELLEREHVTEQFIADQLEISRTPVRKAFNRLVSDSYLENIQNVGVRVKAKKLTTKDFQDCLDLFERLVNHYLFDIEKIEKKFDAENLYILIENMEVAVISEDQLFEKYEDHFWQEVLKYSENLYAKKIMVQTVKYILFNTSEITQILQNFRSIKIDHFKELSRLLEEEKYPLARREVRILFNKLKLNVIETELTYS